MSTARGSRPAHADPDPSDKRRFWVDGEPEVLGRVREILARLQAEA
ncbi:hypothetical protein PIB19_20130 [Sphingomonas sp. 7/4-4]|nr:hypothetical protein [Sphingomonas sp. 7/4-4]WBY07593.1 hypothetical protein PIB19_20130 [Sphingomonas sp. 7/4-4]